MSKVFSDPRGEIDHPVEIGQVYTDSRTGDLIKLLYVDEDAALLRDEDGSHRLEKRKMLDSNIGAGRYSITDEDFEHTGPFSALTSALERFERQDGRKASHKAEALRDVLSSISGEDKNLEEVPFEDVEGIGARTGARLRSQGTVTVADVREASDSELLDIGGIGEKNLSNLREHVDSYS